MAPATPLPRKYRSQLQRTTEELELMAKRCRIGLHALREQPSYPRKVEQIFHELESTLYRLVAELVMVETADHCQSCPKAAPMSVVQTHFLTCAQQMEQLAHYMRTQAGQQMVTPQEEREKGVKF